MIFRNMVHFLISLLPDFDLPIQIMSAFTEAVNWVSIVVHYLPVGTFLICVSVYLTFFVLCSVLSGIMQLF